MNAGFKIFLSMSLSGGLLILVLLLGKQFLKDKISRQWQYYIWLVVVLRLLLPFGPEVSLLGKAYQAVDRSITQAAPVPPPQPVLNTQEGLSTPSVGAGPDQKNMDSQEEDRTTAHAQHNAGTLQINAIWLVWLMVALGLLIRKITIYQGFVRYLKAGLAPVSDIERLDRLAAVSEQAGIKRPVELCVNPLVSSPLLLGFFHPCIVLPSVDTSEKDFDYIVLHELTHYKRLDLFYKWLVQVTVCLHWFNPLVHLMSREITKACEFSCDEAVLAKMGGGNAQDYGKTLLDAMAAVGKYQENLGAVTLSENKRLLKERLSAIMRFQKQSKPVKLLIVVLTLCVALGAVFVGTYTMGNAQAASRPDTTLDTTGGPSRSLHINSAAAGRQENSLEMETLALKGTTYYRVANEAQLRAIGTGKYGMDLHYMQQADIQISADEWVPIGTWDAPFTGTYNGNGFEITGLTMTDPDAEIVGLFGVAEHAEIYNVTLRDYDTASAGKNAENKSVGAILAIGKGVRSYDNYAYPRGTATGGQGDSSQIEWFYEAGSLPLFQIAFSQLDEKAQGECLDKIYTNQQIMFWDAAVGLLDEDCTLIQRYAEKTYADDDIAFFSILAMHMGDETLEKWLERALEDEDWAFQSVLFDALGRSDEFDEREEKQEKEWEEAHIAKYRAVGVTMDGKNYYYQGQLVHIFLDIVRPEKSFYTLSINPKGTVNIKIVRDADNIITDVAYMTDAEVTELLGDMDGPDGEADDADNILAEMLLDFITSCYHYVRCYNKNGVYNPKT